MIVLIFVGFSLYGCYLLAENCYVDDYYHYDERQCTTLNVATRIVALVIPVMMAIMILNAIMTIIVVTSPTFPACLKSRKTACLTGPYF